MTGEWSCWCPACGEEVFVDIDNEEYQTLDSGKKEWFVRCQECDQGFYVSESYD